MSAADKDKLDNIEAEANVNKIESIKLNSSTLDIADDKSVNIDLSNYPTTSDMKDAINSTASQMQIKLVAGDNITISGNTISATDTTYNVATVSADGLMSANDKIAVNGMFDEIVPFYGIKSIESASISDDTFSLDGTRDPDDPESTSLSSGTSYVIYNDTTS